MVLDGRNDAFDVLFDRHVADSLWYAREVLGSWGEAEDAVRHSFAAAHAYLATRGRETDFKPWLQTILGNYCLSMLHARTPHVEQSADGGTVVDLGEWRLRRKLFGAALPIGPGAGLREGVMAACGIGAGATTAGAPLLGGVLAKVAVVAVLAGGVGVAGNIAPDRAASVDTGTPASAERTADAASRSRAGIDRERESPGRAEDTPRPTAPESDGAPRPVRDEFAQADDPSAAKPSPRIEPSPSTESGAANVPLPTQDSTIDDATVALPPPVESTLRRVVDVVKARTPAAGDRSEIRLPDSVDLSKIGHDLRVTTVTSPVDVHTLLSRGTAVLPK